MEKEVLNNVNVEIAELMKETLANQFVLYTKARNYHWNVTGPYFLTLHAEFEKIYNELAEDIDKVAERIRALGFKAPGTMNEFLEFSSLIEDPDESPVYSSMVETIINNFEIIIKEMNNDAKKIEDDFNDKVSAGMLYNLVEKYQKTVWLLMSFLEK
jgi:starvation-inducible DNA-binding protein